MSEHHKKKLIYYSALPVFFLTIFFGFILIKKGFLLPGYTSIIMSPAFLISLVLSQKGYLKTASYPIIILIFLNLMIVLPLTSFYIDSYQNTFNLLLILPTLSIPLIIYTGLISDTITTCIIGILSGFLNIFYIKLVLDDVDTKYSAIPSISFGVIISLILVIVFKKIRDLNEARLLESILEAEEANKEKSNFLANMSHEIRTPMNGVLGMNSLLLETNLNSQQKLYAETVKNSAESLLSIINDILDLSKIEAGKLELELIDFSINELMNDFILSMAHNVENSGVEFICIIDPQIPDGMYGDPGRIRQILINLAGNAFKFTKKGAISLTVKLKEITSDGILIHFDIKDSGIGIPENRHSKLFDSFTQADTSTTRKYGGTGLGLSISKQLSEMMGGSIGFTSNEGKGSTFWFEIRVNKSVKKNSKKRTDFSGFKILIICENPTSISFFETYAKFWNMEYVTIRNGIDALEFFETNSNIDPAYDLVLFDFNISKISGGIIVNKVKMNPGFKNIPLIFITTISERENIANQFEDGNFLLKPVRPNSLEMCIKKVLGISGNENVKQKQNDNIKLNNPAKILIVDDNITNQKIAQINIENMGLQTYLASNGEEAFELVKKNNISLIFMDCQMPVLDGFDSTREIRKFEKTSEERKNKPEIPIIAMTANAMNGDAERCIKCGMNDYLAKPVSKKAIYHMLLKWIG